MIQSETRERFILDLVEQLDGANIIEVHFFAPRRVSGVERGVAVIAARQRAPHVDAPEGEGEAIDAPGGETLGALAEGLPAEPGEPASDGAEAPPVTVEADAVDLPSLDESPYAPETVDESEGLERYTVFTATYRHTLKGPDRGTWETSVKAEADAPLVTVDQVVRGVQRRAEDTDEVERLSGDEIRAVVDACQPAAG